MALKPCWPEWLTRRNRDRFGPEYGSDVPYPVYQVQPSILSADNSNTSSQGKNDAYFQGVASTIALANIDTTIIHIMPNNVYDTISIVAFPFPDQTPNANANLRVPSFSVPIFFSMDRPGRITTETQIQGSQEAMLASASVFSPIDPSSFPTCIQVPQTQLNQALNAPSAVYTNFLYPTVKTDRPFYFWFGDGINTLPAAAITGIAFKASWYVQGR